MDHRKNMQLSSVSNDRASLIERKVKGIQRKAAKKRIVRKLIDAQLNNLHNSLMITSRKSTAEVLHQAILKIVHLSNKSR